MPTPNLVMKFAGLNVYVQGSNSMFHVLCPQGVSCVDHIPRITFSASDYNNVKASIPKQETLETFDGDVLGSWRFRGLLQLLLGGDAPSCYDHTIGAGGLQVPIVGDVQAGSGQVDAGLLGPNPGSHLAARVDVPTGTSTANPVGIMPLEFVQPDDPTNVVLAQQDYAMGVMTTLPMAQNQLGQWTATFVCPGYFLELVTTDDTHDIEVVISNLPALPETPQHFDSIWDFASADPAIRAIPQEPGGGAGQAGCVGGEMDPPP